jgi:hypothetical protein
MILVRLRIRILAAAVTLFVTAPFLRGQENLPDGFFGVAEQSVVTDFEVVEPAVAIGAERPELHRYFSFAGGVNWFDEFNAGLIFWSGGWNKAWRKFATRI